MSRRFNVIADSAVDGFLETDKQGNIFYANRAAAEIFLAKGPEQLLGHNIVDHFMVGDTKQRFTQVREDYARTNHADIIGQREPTKIELQRFDGTAFFAEITVSEYEIGSEKRFCVIVRDISYRVALEGNQKGLT
jgi:PAS domain S-box-containing protein